MNKKSLLCVLVIAICALLFVVILMLVKRPENKENVNKKTGGWTFNTNIKTVSISKDALDAFNKATEEYDGMTFEPVALLGTQVVAGTNYMFLCKGTTVTATSKTDLKVVIVYKDLNNKSEITSVKDFDYTKYTNKNIENNSQKLSGGWQVTSPNDTNKLDEKIQNIFDNATSTLAGISYKPIAVLGTQVVAGKNYAILCYGHASYPDTQESIYLVTIYDDINGGQEITYQAYIDISEFND